MINDQSESLIFSGMYADGYGFLLLKNDFDRRSIWIIIIFLEIMLNTSQRMQDSSKIMFLFRKDVFDIENVCT